MQLRDFEEKDVSQMATIWNEVVKEDDAFPQERGMDEGEASAFFASQSRTRVAVEGNHILGLSILHPNGIGHCGGNANASYAVEEESRGKHIGEALVRDSLAIAKEMGYHNLQFNAVLASNTGAIHLYEKLSFSLIGTLHEGYRHDDGSYEDLLLFFHQL